MTPWTMLLLGLVFPQVSATPSTRTTVTATAAHQTSRPRTYPGASRRLRSDRSHFPKRNGPMCAVISNVLLGPLLPPENVAKQPRSVVASSGCSPPGGHVALGGDRRRPPR